MAFGLLLLFLRPLYVFHLNRIHAMKMKALLFLLLGGHLLAAGAAYAQTVDSGATGYCSWTLSGIPLGYTLTISGSGAMEDYYDGGDAPWYPYGSSIKTLTIEEGVTRIGFAAFAHCSGLTSVNIPSSVASIGNFAFAHCSGLTSVSIPSSVVSIGYWVFASCRNLTSVNIPNSVTSIGDGAFSGCSSLAQVNIPQSVTSISSGTFFGCRSLTQVDIPNSITSIGNVAFSGCSGLRRVSIPSSVTSIGEWAFYACSGLTRLSIPSSVVSIGSGAFEDCRSLSLVVNLRATPQRISDSVFAGVNADFCTLLVPESATSAYKSANGWKDFTNIAAQGN